MKQFLILIALIFITNIAVGYETKFDKLNTTYKTIEYAEANNPMHSGRTDSSGCHEDRSTGTRHCH